MFLWSCIWVVRNVYASGNLITFTFQSNDDCSVKVYSLNGHCFYYIFLELIKVSPLLHMFFYFRPCRLSPDRHKGYTLHMWWCFCRHWKTYFREVWLVSNSKNSPLSSSHQVTFRCQLNAFFCPGVMILG